MMSADDIFPKLAGSRYYSTFDFCKGYWQITMEENSKDCTTFVNSRGLFRFKVMPFGLVNAGSTYNRMVRKLLDGATNLQTYVDDVIGHTKNWHEHIHTLRDFFEQVKQGRFISYHITELTMALIHQSSVAPYIDNTIVINSC